VAVETDVEERVWDQLIRNIEWDPRVDFGVTVRKSAKARSVPKLQIFELLVAAIFARLCPEYEWCVTPVGRDKGSDFIGRGQLFQDEELGIAAAITVGGQCKKQKRVKDVIAALGSSLTRMADSINPTFFVVALSARVDQHRIDEARVLIERERRRHCHILHRDQIEGLIHCHLAVLSEILDEGERQGVLEQADVGEILSYFAASGGAIPEGSIEISTPERGVLAGEPFSVTVNARLLPASTAGLRLIWRPGAENDDRPVTLLSPIGADGERGVEFAAPDDPERPIGVQRSLEMLTYSVGKVDLGEVLVGAPSESAQWLALGSVRVVENMRPRFYEPPFRAARVGLEHGYDIALGGGVAVAGVVGAGGSGKSRLCEEFALDRRRLGCTVVTARQAKILDDPYRLLADLFAELVGEDFSIADRADRVIEAITQYDPVTAEKAEAAIRAIFGTADQRSAPVTDRYVLAALLVLIVARGSRTPLIVHLQDLHWCSADVLLLLEKLIWELERSFKSLQRHRKSGILLVLEGRVQERQAPGGEGWSSRHFEAFLQKLDCPIVTCTAFEPEDGLAFIRRLFEHEYEGGRAGADLLRFQDELVERVFQSAGGNPFHSLEQVRILKESGVLGQNPRTGLLYLIRPELGPPTLPDTVFESIQLRWRYLRDRAPELALLIWAAALLEDRIPTPLFRRLWEELAPQVSLRDVDATDMLWTGGGEEREVAFRHEHYFRSIRKFEVSAADRERVVGAYSSWLAGKRNPADRFRRARALLSLPEPEVDGAQELMKSALGDARKRGDQLLSRRIATTSLDVAWDEDVELPAGIEEFFRLCDDELELIRELLGSDRAQAARRLEALSVRLDERFSRVDSQSPQNGAETQRRRLTAEVLRSQLLYNDGQPAMASEVSARAVAAIEALLMDEALRGGAVWESLEMEARFSYASALALSGRIDDALQASEGAVEIARRSSSPLAHRVVSTYANILLARDPEMSESILRDCLAEVDSTPEFSETRHAIEINLGMALALRAYQRGGANGRSEQLVEAREILNRVFTTSFQVGQYPLSGAAALMRGIVSALNGDGEDVTWFAQAVAAASRGHKMETLWRAHINLATAMYQADDEVTESVCNHSRAALEILEDTLSPYPQPDRSSRFGLVRVPLAQAARFLVMGGDNAGHTALVRYPELRSSFKDAEAGELREDSGAYRSHEWLRIRGEDYVIY